MKTFSLLIVTIQLGLALAASAYEPTTIETQQGKTYVSCKILKRDPDGVSFTHSKGMAKVLYSDLSEPMKNALGYDAAKADAYVKERKDAEKAKREQQAKLAEAYAAAQAKYAAQQPIVYVQQPNGGYMRSLMPLAPVLGLGRMGAPFYGGGHHGHGAGQGAGWTSGNGMIVPGTGGVYVPQSNGTVFYGAPGVSYSPTLGYTNLNSNGTTFFGQPSGVVQGAAVQGGTTISGHHH